MRGRLGPGRSRAATRLATATTRRFAPPAEPCQRVVLGRRLAAAREPKAVGTPVAHHRVELGLLARCRLGLGRHPHAERARAGWRVWAQRDAHDVRARTRVVRSAWPPVVGLTAPAVLSGDGHFRVVRLVGCRSSSLRATPTRCRFKTRDHRHQQDNQAGAVHRWALWMIAGFRHYLNYPIGSNYLISSNWSSYFCESRGGQCLSHPEAGIVAPIFLRHRRPSIPTYFLIAAYVGSAAE